MGGGLELGTGYEAQSEERVGKEMEVGMGKCGLLQSLLKLLNGILQSISNWQSARCASCVHSYNISEDIFLRRKLVQVARCSSSRYNFGLHIVLAILLS